jgi:hypothetical protein
MPAYPSMLCIIVAALILLFSITHFSGAYADNPAKIIAKSSFVDSKDRLHVVGTIRNTGNQPIQVTMGLHVHDSSGYRVMHQSPYGRIVWPLNDSPFKFVLSSGSAGEPYIMDVKEVSAPNYVVLLLNYSSMAVGEDKAFMGTIKNTASFNVYNVSIFASVRSDNATQLDTVRSNVIPVLRPGEKQTFVATPDPSVKSKVFYYSCAGVDLNAPIPTLDAGSGRVIPYELDAVAQISSLRYNNSTDSIAFGVRPYDPAGAPLSLKIPEVAANQTLRVLMDGQLYDNASFKGDGKTMNINLFVPKGDHNIEIQGVENVPEFPLAALALTIITGGLLVATKVKTAFKVL